jgi:phospholipase C
MSTAQRLRALQAVAPIIVASLVLPGCDSLAASRTPSAVQAAELRAPLHPLTKGGASLDSIQHIVVLYQENWSFDALYGHYRGANGVGTGMTIPQYAWNGPALTTAPQPLNYAGNPDKRFPATMPLETYLAVEVRPRLRPHRRHHPPLLPRTVPDRQRPHGQVRQL